MATTLSFKSKSRPKSGTKVKRKSLYPQGREKKSNEKIRLQWVPTREKPIKKAPEKLPYYKERAPKYQPANPAQQRQVPLQPKPAGNLFLTLFIIVIVILFIFTAWKIMSLDDRLDDGGDGGSSGCVTTCNGAAIVIAPQCNCPPDSRYRDTISGGYKQCICT